MAVISDKGIIAYQQLKCLAIGHIAKRILVKYDQVGSILTAKTRVFRIF